MTNSTTIFHHRDVSDLLECRESFSIEGCRVWDGEKFVFLRSVTFEFHEITEAARELRESIRSQPDV